MAPSTSSFSRWVTCSAKSAESGSASWRRSALASLARWRNSSRRLSNRSRTASVSTSVPPGTFSGRPLTAALVLEPLLQFVERLDEFRDPLALQLSRDALQVHIEPLETLAHIRPFGDMPLEPQLRAPEATVGIECLERHGVDGARHHQFLDVFDRAVAGILGGGRGPQQALRVRTARGELLPLPARGDLFVDLVGAAGAG